MFTRKVLMLFSVSLFIVTALITSSLLFAGGSAHNATQGIITKKNNPIILYDDIVNTSDNTSPGSIYKYSDGINNSETNSEDISAAGMNSDTASLDELQNSIPQSDGEWIDINEDQVDPEAVSGNNDEVDNDIYVNIIWRPVNVEPDWNPYTNGYWEYTDDGCSWVSNYSWGTTYHYGRWWHSDRWGWVWSPGRHRSNSWVSWRDCDDYTGWYPISPRWHYNHHSHHYEPTNGYVSNQWLFVPRTSLANTIITKKVAIDNNMNPKLFKKSKPVNNVLVVNDKIKNAGPAPTKYNVPSSVKINNKNADNIKKTNEINTRTNDKIAKTNDTKINTTKTGINKTDISNVNITKSKNKTSDNTKNNQTKNNSQVNNNNVRTPKESNSIVKNTVDKNKANTTTVKEPKIINQKKDNSPVLKEKDYGTEKINKSANDYNVPRKTESQNNKITKTEQPKQNYNTEVKTEPVKKNYNTEKQTTEKPVIKNEEKQTNDSKPNVVKEKTKAPVVKENIDNGK